MKNHLLRSRLRSRLRLLTNDEPSFPPLAARTENFLFRGSSDKNLLLSSSPCSSPFHAGFGLVSERQVSIAASWTGISGHSSRKNIPENTHNKNNHDLAGGLEEGRLFAFDRCFESGFVFNEKSPPGLHIWVKNNDNIGCHLSKDVW